MRAWPAVPFLSLAGGAAAAPIEKGLTVTRMVSADADQREAGSAARFPSGATDA
jgi:hypothetical protein